VSELETLHVRYGSASQICPVCKRIKPSGRQLPQQCILCQNLASAMDELCVLDDHEVEYIRSRIKMMKETQHVALAM
jgi:hypothetical protein